MTDALSSDRSRGTSEDDAARELDWRADGQSWPNHEVSEFVLAKGIRWHVQRVGTSGPVCLLIHGSGASTHSWQGLISELEQDVTLVAMDLPAHGFTSTPPQAQLSLPGMTSGLARLLQQLDVQPTIIVGHSAGAAIACRLVLQQDVNAKLIVSINGALRPTGGARTPLLGPLTRRVLTPSLIPNWVARRARRPEVFNRLMGETGSQIPGEYLQNYRRLAASPKHVAGALRMMAHWDSRALPEQLRSLPIPLWLVACDEDGMVPATLARQISEQLPDSRLIELSGSGHLVHEEDPGAIAAIVREGLKRVAEGAHAGE